MAEYKLKTGKLGEKVVKAYGKTEQAFCDAFLEKDENSPSSYSLKAGRVGNTLLEANKRIENTVVGTYKKIEDAFVERFLEKKD